MPENVVILRYPTVRLIFKANQYTVQVFVQRFLFSQLGAGDYSKCAIKILW